MKTRLWVWGAAICGGVVFPGMAQDVRPERPAPPAAAPSSKASDAPAPSTTTETLQKLGVPAPRYPAHPPAKPSGARGGARAETTAKVVMPTPPPSLRTETKPPAPAEGLVWVPGHYVPINEQWRWVAGEWGVPATPASVWIEATYDRKTASWSPGYWQPDRPEPSEAAAPTKPSNGYNG